MGGYFTPAPLMDHIVTFSSRGSGWIQFSGLKSVLWEWFQAQAKCRGGLTQSFLRYKVFLILEWPNWKHFSAGGKELSAGCLSKERRSSVLRRPRGRLHHWDMEALFKVRAGPQQMAQLEPQAHRVQAPVQGGGARGCVFRIPGPCLRKLACRETLAFTLEFWK